MAARGVGALAGSSGVGSGCGATTSVGGSGTVSAGSGAAISGAAVSGATVSVGVGSEGAGVD